MDVLEFKEALRQAAHVSTGYEGPNLCDRKGAILLKLRLEAYWRERGYAIQAEIIETGFHAALRCSRYDVRSSLVDGLPPASARIVEQAA